MCYLFSVCICSLGHPAYNVHAPYCYLWPARLHRVFPHISQTARFSGKRCWIKTTVFFSIQYFCETFLALERTERDIVISIHSCLCKISVCVLICSDFNKTCIFSTHFRKMLKFKFYENPIYLGPSCSMRTDGQTGITKLIGAFRNFEKASKSLSLHK